MTTWMKYFQPKKKVSRIWKEWKHERSLGQRHQLFETVSPFSNFVSGFSDNFSLLQVQTKTVSEAWPKMQRRLHSWLCIFRYNRPCTRSQASRPSWEHERNEVWGNSTSCVNLQRQLEILLPTSLFFVSIQPSVFFRCKVKLSKRPDPVRIEGCVPIWHLDTAVHAHGVRPQVFLGCQQGMHLIPICCPDSVFSLLQVQTEIVKEAWPHLRWRLCISRYSHPCTCSQASKPCWVWPSASRSVFSLEPFPLIPALWRRLILSYSPWRQMTHLPPRWIWKKQGELFPSFSNFFSHQPEAVIF